MFQTEYYIAGIAPFGEYLMVLAYAPWAAYSTAAVLAGHIGARIDFRPHRRRDWPSFGRRYAEPDDEGVHLPELHIVKRNDGDELATDALSVVGSVPPSPRLASPRLASADPPALGLRRALAFVPPAGPFSRGTKRTPFCAVARTDRPLVRAVSPAPIFGSVIRLRRAAHGGL
jgi:hypothetical protein